MVAAAHSNGRLTGDLGVLQTDRLPLHRPDGPLLFNQTERQPLDLEEHQDGIVPELVRSPCDRSSPCGS